MNRATSAIVIAVLAMMLLWFGSALVRVENERYAMVVGMCKWDALRPIKPCLEGVQSRTSWSWHLFYALLDR